MYINTAACIYLSMRSGFRWGQGEQHDVVACFLQFDVHLCVRVAVSPVGL